MKIDLVDWENILVTYLFNDIVIVQNMDAEQRTRVYKGNKLLYEKPGVYYLEPNNSEYLKKFIPLVKYDTGELGPLYMIINTKGEIVYESPDPENVLSIDEKYIQVERGNYWGVIDYKGNFIIRAIKNELIND